MLSLPRLLLPLGLSLILSGMAPLLALDFSDLGAAEAELEELSAEWQTAHDDSPSDETGENLALTLQTLGIVERQAGKPDEALQHLTTASELLSKHAPSLLPDCLEAKALTLQDLGELEESEMHLREVLKSRQASAKDPVDPDLSATLDHLALNLLYQGRYPEVAPLLDQAIIAAGKDDPTALARLLDHRGRLLHTLGSHARAIESFQEALALPFEDPELRLTLQSQIALAQLRLGKVDQARAGTEAVANAASEIFKSEPLRVVPYYNNLGELDLSLGKPEDALPSFKKCLDILEASLSPSHPNLIGPLNNLGVAEQAMGNLEDARSHLERAAALQADHLPPTHLRVAETQRNLAHNALLSGSADAESLIKEATMRGLDLLDRLIREGSEKERLNFLERFELLSLPCATGDAELISDVLLASKARLLDAMLSDTSLAERITWQDIQSSLSPGTAFIDTCRFFTTTTPAKEEYGAILILPDGPPKWIRLGAAADLRGWLDAFRKRLSWRSATFAGDAGPAPPIKLKGILRSLHRGFWKPLAEHLSSDTQHIAYSPSGILHFLPLAALLDEEDHPLSSRYLQITTVGSGRDLLGTKPDKGLDENPWAVLTVSKFPKSSVVGSDDPLLSLLSELESMPGTIDEAARLKRIAPDGSVFLTDEQATESALHDLSPAPSVLHLGCHAFFLDDPNGSTEIPVDFDERSDLLYSGGLVLYRGAERSIDSPRLSDSDDLVFPSEIARFSLQDTRLVTLSSCESGAGTPVSGEGVLGLRRAFSIAGAREVVVALWPVSDASTPTFMEKFYLRASASGRPAQALWQTQGDFLIAASNDEEFELAVLRYAPFVLSQNTPLVPGSSLPPAEIPKASSLLSSPWRYLLAIIPLLIFFIARSSNMRRNQSL
ncbi:CHAT domain-containing protein [Haloferula sp.]|uniref:CHAT domain-containing protein n=1 Tax=Haloferula sp. TaxID=2497595 RepID=UPI00329DC41E